MADEKSLTLKIKGDVEDARRNFKGLGNDLGALKQGLVSLAGPLAALTSAAGFGALVAQQIELGDELSKTSQKLGIAVEDLSAYQYAARLSGVSNEELTGSLAKLSKAIQEAATDSASEAARMFEVLGVSVKDNSGKVRELSTIFEGVAAKLATVRDGTAKTTAEMALFGRSGFELAPLLNNLEELTEEARRTGNIISTDFAQAAEEFNDTVERMQISLGIFLAKSEEGPGILRGLTNAFKAAQFVALGLAQGLEELGTSLGAYAAAAADVAKLNFAEARRTMQLLEGDIDRIKKKGEAARAALFAEPSDTPSAPASGGTIDLSLPAKEKRSKKTPRDDFDKEARRDLERLIREEEQYNEALEKSAEQLRNTLDPARQFYAEMARLDELLARGKITRDEWLAGTLEVQGRLDDLGKETKKTTDEMTEFSKNAARNMQGVFSQYFFDVMEGRMTSLGDLFEQMLKRMAAEMLAKATVEAIFGAFGGGGGLLAGVFHSGGVVGRDSATREVSPFAFIGAQRLHEGGTAGLRDDEVPAILKRGEMVLTPEQMRGGFAGDVKVTVENKGTPIQAADTQVSFDVGGMTVKVITEDIHRGGPISGALSRTFNLRRGGR